MIRLKPCKIGAVKVPALISENNALKMFGCQILLSMGMSTIGE
jgi:hypothetical protein